VGRLATECPWRGARDQPICCEPPTVNIDDFIIGAYRADPTGLDTGRSCVIFGVPTAR